MEKAGKGAEPDRWWIVALIVASVGTVLALLLWHFPTSKWVWLPAGFILLFTVVLSINPRYRYWRRASGCFATAGALAFVPTINANAHLAGIGAFEFVSELHPLVVLGFLGAGLYLSSLDFHQQASSLATAGIGSTNTEMKPSNSPHAITGLTAGRDIIITQGISERTDISEPAAQNVQKSLLEQAWGEEDLVWEIVENIKEARRKLDTDNVDRLLSKLEKCFKRTGSVWPKVLRTETLLLMAEDERATIARARAAGKQADFTRLHALLKELHDA